MNYSKESDKSTPEKTPSYSLRSRIVTGLVIAAFLFVAAIYYGVINP